MVYDISFMPDFTMRKDETIQQQVALLFFDMGFFKRFQALMVYKVMERMLQIRQFQSHVGRVYVYFLRLITV